MTSEEFVGKFTRRYDCPLFHLHNPNVITKGNALIAVEMARQEEREKAAKIFIKLIKAFNMSGKEGYDSLEKDFLELLSQ